MFVIRELLNRGEILEWAVMEGFQEIVQADTLHVTVRKFTDLNLCQQLVPSAKGLTVRASRRRILLNFGGVVVLAFACGKLSRRHAEFRRAGMTWFYRDYAPHVSFALDDLDLRDIRPFYGGLHFGPEVVKPDPLLNSLPNC
ncbi:MULTISPECIES: phage prohead protein [unclassified Rhizobium]|uniref:phage prohead protein n=1 Tax=unclassified Rhizobium TaxID=2613769 RepID=UPI0016141030|nr:MULTISPECIES: phage prohead protein [unclassified Rhizobium]